jgi:arylsulfatase A-like enzyme
MIRSKFALSTILLLFMTLSSCGSDNAIEALNGEPATQNIDIRPNMIVVLVDDMRFDEIGAAGHPYIKTPNIDRIADEGAHFVNSFTVNPLCSPSRATLLTGQHAHYHGITDNLARNELSHELETFPRRLQKNGYDNHR